MGNALIEIKKTSDPITLSEYELAYDMDRAAHDASYISTSLLTEISSAFFKSYSALTYVSLANVSVIGQSAFENCINLNAIYLPSLDTFDAGSVFSNCKKINKMVTKSSVIHIRASATGLFYNCQSMTQMADIDLVDDKIPDKMFAYCSNLKRVNLLSDNCTIIGVSAFYGCTKLEYVNNLNFAKITDIGAGAFAYNSLLTDLEIYNFSKYTGISLNSYAFASCINLNYVSLPDNIRTLNQHAFADCTNLKQINLNNVNYIANYAIYNVPNLSIININANELRLYFDLAYYPLEGRKAAIKASNLLTIGTAWSGSSNYSRLYNCQIYINDGYSFPKLETIHSITLSGGQNFSGTLYLPNLKYIDGYCRTTNANQLTINNCIGVQGDSPARGNGFICDPNLITLEAMNLILDWNYAVYNTAGVDGYEAYYSYNIYIGDVSKYERNTKIKNILAPYIGLCPGEYNFTYLCSDNVYRKTYSDVRRYYNLSNKKMYSTVEILGTRSLASFFVSRQYPYDVSSNKVLFSWFSPISLFENLKEIYAGQYNDPYYSVSNSYPTYAICYTVSKINMFYDYSRFRDNHVMHINFGTLHRIFPQLSNINMDVKFSAYDENNYSEPLDIVLYDISKIINVNTNVDELINNYMLSYYLTFGDYVSDTDVNKYLGMINSKCTLNTRFGLNFKNGCSINNLIVNARHADLNTFTIMGTDMHINNINITDCLDWKMKNMYFIVNGGLIDTISFNESSNNVESSLVTNNFGCYGSINNINFNVPDWSYINLQYQHNSKSFAIRNMNFQYAKTISFTNIYSSMFDNMLIQNINAPNCTNFSVKRLPIRNISLGNELVSFFMGTNTAIENISLTYNGTCSYSTNFNISNCPNLKNLFIKASEIFGGYAAKNVLSMNADYIEYGTYLNAKNIYINTKSLYGYYYPICDYMYIKASSISRFYMPSAAKTSASSPCLIDLDVSFYCGSNIVSIYYTNTNAIIRVRPSLLSLYLSDSFYNTKPKMQFIALS